MKNTMIAVLAAAVAGLLAVPAGALAQASGSDCSYTTTGGTAAGVQAGSGGMTGDPSTTAVGACVNAPTPVGTFQGGSVEVGLSGTELYGVIDGDNENVDPLDGYVALSNYESGTAADGDCSNGPDQGQPGTTNSGGCFGVDRGPWVAVPLIACGNSSGNRWNSTSRDGCSNP